MLPTTLVVVTLLAAHVAHPAHAPLAPPAPAACATPEARQLDFWVGDWDLTGRLRTAEGWRDTPATNRVRAILDGCVIEERFRMNAEGGLRGVSVSVYDAPAAAWRQTWVDNQGGYLVFRGGMADGRMVLATAPAPQASGDTVVSRMVFHDITADRFVWDWERSTDNGRTWTLRWTLQYRRRA
jgi:hypothetical protein